PFNQRKSERWIRVDQREDVGRHRSVLVGEMLRGWSRHFEFSGEYLPVIPAVVYGSVEKMILSLSSSDRTTQVLLHFVDSLLAHQPVRRPLPAQNADQTAFRIQFDLLVSDELLRVRH